MALVTSGSTWLVWLWRTSIHNRISRPHLRWTSFLQRRLVCTYNSPDSRSTCIISIISIMCIKAVYDDGFCWQAQKDGKFKNIKLLGKDLLTLVDYVFWNLPFCCVRQSNAVSKMACVTEEERSTKREEIVRSTTCLMMLFVLAIKMHVLAIPVFKCPF